MLLKKSSNITTPILACRTIHANTDPTRLSQCRLPPPRAVPIRSQVTNSFRATRTFSSSGFGNIRSGISSIRSVPLLYPASSGKSSRWKFSTSAAMAKSKFDYVRQFEIDDPCLPNCWIVIRIDGKNFHKFSDAHNYMKPNDERGLGLMTCAAQRVLSEFNDIVLAYGQSDEYSFVFHKNSQVYNRRASKIMTNLVSLFASSFTMYWPRYFNTQELQFPPAFDARAVLYPSDENLRDYLSWRQADCHINNLYNTCFWKLVQDKGLTPAQSEARLRGTLSSDKNELLFSEFNINYNNIPEVYRKGTVLVRNKEVDGTEKNMPSNNEEKTKYSRKKVLVPCLVLHCDIIGKQFWEEHSYLLSNK